MLQRPQTLFLLLSTLLYMAALVLPHFQVTHFAGQGIVDVASYQILRAGILEGVKVSAAPNELAPASASFLFFGLLECLAAIFLFKRRPLQLRLLTIASIFSVSAFFASAINAYHSCGSVPQILAGTLTGVFAILATLVTNNIAKAMIAKDERTVRSMDRLR
jgi:hypothetical protein